MNDVLKKLIQTWDRESDIEDSIRLLLQIPPQEGSVQAALTIIAKTLGTLRRDLDDLTKKVIGEMVENKKLSPVSDNPDEKPGDPPYYEKGGKLPPVPTDPDAVVELPELQSL